MAQIRKPLSSEAARGRFGDELVFTHYDNKSIARRYVTPANPRTALQTAQRDKFRFAQNLYRRDYDEYALALPLWSATDRNAYLAAVQAFKTLNVVPAKSFANGFTSLDVPQRAYAIRHSLDYSLILAKNALGQLVNKSNTPRTPVFVSNAGTVVGVPTELAADAAVAVPAGAVGVIVATATSELVSLASGDPISAAGSLFDQFNSELIIISTIGVSVV